MKYYWINDEYLFINGEKLTPQEAYKKYPQNADELFAFVEKSRDRRIDKFKKRICRSSCAKSSYEEKMNQALEDDPTLDEMFKKINNAIHEILNRPEIKAAHGQRQLAYKLFEYIVNSSEYQESIMDEKKGEKSLLKMEIHDIYRCLCQHRSVCSSDAAALSFLFRRVGVSSCHITIEKGKQPKNTHEVVRMDFDGQAYICDPTLARTTLREGIIPKVDPSVFAFTPDKFFTEIYPSYEIKFEHKPFELSRDFN